MRALVALLAILISGCVTCRDAEPPREKALPHLFTENGKLGWGGLTLEMSRAEAEAKLGRSLRVRTNAYTDVCGEFYSLVDLHGQRVNVDWSSAAPDATIEVISVLYGGGERMDYDSDLREAALAAVPELEGETEHSSFLTLRSNPSHAVNLKSSGEGVFFVTLEGCLD